MQPWKAPDTNKPNSPKREIKSSEDCTMIQNGCTRNPLTLWTMPILDIQVWVHILRDPQSVQLRNATATAYTGHINTSSP